MTRVRAGVPLAAEGLAFRAVVRRRERLFGYAACDGSPGGRCALRVIAGRLGGRRLRSVVGPALRPTSDRVREALFARLEVEGMRVLDLFAGTGALGIEALSRGASSAVFVEKAPAALGALRGNLAELELQSVSRVIHADAAAALRRLGRAGERFQLVLLDPPYASDAAERALEALGRSEVMAPGAQVVLERSRRHPLPRVEGFAVRDERRYGDTLVTRLEIARDGLLAGTTE